jgi:hypothetical protein
MTALNKARRVSSAKNNEPRPARKKAHELRPSAIAPEPMPEPEKKDGVRNRAMLVNLSVHQWLASATDHQITAEISQSHGVASDMGKYQKNLLSKTALARLRTAGGKLRSNHNRLTLPWDEWGTRILSAKAWTEYNATMRQGIDEFEQIFREELEDAGPSGKSKYEEAKDEARRLLNGAFREEDYPSIQRLKAKFGARITVRPIPAADHFLLDLGDDATAQVRREIEADANDKVGVAMKGLFERLHGVVSKFVVALKAEKTDAIRKTLFSSIETVLAALPVLNVTGDPALEAFSAEIRTLVAGMDAKELRESEQLRDSVLVKADAILAKMNDFLG